MRAADTLPPIIYKIHEGSITDGGTVSNVSLVGDEFTDFQVDVIAQVIAELRNEFESTMNSAIADAIAPLRESIARLEGQMTALIAMIGGDSRAVKTVEASEVVRKLPVS
jgi:hypothetical protein